MGEFLTKLNIILPYDPAIVLLGIHSNKSKTHVHKNQHMDVHSSFMYNCPKLEATKVSVKR